MYETIATAKMSHEEWLNLRKMGIGGSDAAAICGLKRGLPHKMQR